MVVLIKYILVLFGTLILFVWYIWSYLFDTFWSYWFDIFCSYLFELFWFSSPDMCYSPFDPLRRIWSNIHAFVFKFIQLNLKPSKQKITLRCVYYVKATHPRHNRCAAAMGWLIQRGSRAPCRYNLSAGDSSQNEEHNLPQVFRWRKYSNYRAFCIMNTPCFFVFLCCWVFI